MIVTSPDKVKPQNYYANPRDVAYLRRTRTPGGHFDRFDLVCEDQGCIFLVYSSFTQQSAFAMARAYGVIAVMLN